MFLDYFALGLLFFVVITLFYAIIAIHDIPYEIAKHRNHPHQDAIHVAGWVSLFTLHAIWPFLWIWATMYRPERGWGFAERARSERVEPLDDALARLEERVVALERGQREGNKRGVVLEREPREGAAGVAVLEREARGRAD
jgi:Protein of unknown function (DUF3302)